MVARDWGPGGDRELLRGTEFQFEKIKKVLEIGCKTT